MLGRLQHPNIVKLLGSYTQNGVHNLLFPLFPMDLEHFMHLEQRFGDFQQITAIYSALEGLSSAIEQVHNLSLNIVEHKVELARIGYHHDIKPANILVDDHTFYLADFGLGRMKPRNETSQTVWKSILGSYVAPECMDEDFGGLSVGRPLDMWSFGCIISEVITYIYRGPAGVDQFRESRFGPGFFPDCEDCYFFTKGGLKKSVVKWFKSLGDICVPDQAEIPPCHLLELSTRLLEIEPTSRPTASETHQEMAFLAVKSLFITVSSEVHRFVREYQLRDPDDEAVHTLFRLETARLDAWGKILCFSTSSHSVEEIAVVHSRYSRISNVLARLLSRVRSSDLPKGTENTFGTIFSIEKPFHEEFYELVSQLWDSVPVEWREKMASLWKQRLLQTDNQADLGTIQSGSHAPSTPADIYSEVSALAMAKRETLRLKLSESHDTERESFLLDSREFSPKVRTADYEIFSYQLHTPVLVEWIYPIENTLHSDRKGKRHLELLAKVLHLRSKPPELCVLDCLGFMLSNDVQTAYGFVYAFPRSIRSIEKRQLKPTSLSDVLVSSDKTVSALGVRFQLAHKLASCLQRLHLIGWLHKNITSNNILFFRGDDSDPSGLLANPHLINFRDARPSNEPTKSSQELERGSTLDHYRHPDYVPGEHYRTVFDYYSVGIVLLEIGTWHAMSEYAKRNRDAAANPAEFRSLLITKYAPRLGHLMGSRYRDATLACLEGSFGCRESGGAVGVLEEGEGVTAEFYDKVVGPLSQLANCFPIIQ